MNDLFDLDNMAFAIEVSLAIARQDTSAIQIKNKQELCNALTNRETLDVILKQGLDYTLSDNKTIHDKSSDKKSYVVGEDVVISGRINPVVPGERLRIDVFDPKGAIFSDNIGVAYFNKDGTFSTLSDSGLLIASHLRLDSVKDYGTYKATITYNG